MNGSSNEKQSYVGCSEAGRRENVYEDEESAEPFAGESNQVVRLPVADAEVLRRGEGSELSPR